MAARRSCKTAVTAAHSPQPMPREAAGPEPVQLQPAFLTARFRLDVTRARLTAELAWGLA